MRAAILKELGQPLVIDDVTLPDSLAYGQVMVKIHYSGICGSQLGEIDGIKGDDPYLPHLLGHEGSGEVIAIGQGVKHVQVGDSVVLHWMQGDGINAAPPKYLCNGKPVNAGAITTFNEYAVLSENRVTAIPTDFPTNIAPLFGCAVTTALGVVNNNAQVKIGDAVVVFGAGGVGLNIIQGAAMTAAYPIIAIDIHDNRLDLAKECGATHIINSKNTDVLNEIAKIIKDHPIDIIIDNTGNVDVINMAYKLVGQQGKIVLVGVPKKGNNINIHSLDLHFGKSISGTKGGSCCPSIDIPKYIRLVEQKKLKLDHIITAQFSLDEINVAIGKMRDGKLSGRCMINMNQNIKV
jgi:S-(hydroxymethyl)glutathione dehydrogenase/alcohol dehydrogenase